MSISHSLYFAYKLVCVDDTSSKTIAVYRGKSAAYKIIDVIPEEYEYCKKVIKKSSTKI